MARRAAASSSSTKKSHSAALTAQTRIVVLHGPEAYLIRERTRLLVEALEAEFDAIEQFTFNGEAPGLDAATILDELRSYGLMQRHKLVIVDNAEIFLADGQKSGDEGEDEEADRESGGGKTRRLMEKYAESPVPDATLLMRASTWRTGKLDKLILKCGAIIRCEAPGADKAVSWCAGRCEKRYGCTIDADAAELLVQRVGPDLALLDMELQKLAALKDFKGRITADDAALMTPMSRQEKAWQIQDAILSGRSDVALQKLRELIGISRQDIVPLSWSVIDLTRKLHAAAQMLRQGESERTISSQLRLWGPAQGAILRAARQLDPADLARLLQAAIDSDRESKSGGADPQRSLEALTVQVVDTIQSA